MKGIFFQKPMELSLLVEGEKWRQGDSIAGNLTIKNRGTDTLSVDDIRVHLAYGELKRVRAKSPDAFEILETAQGPSGIVAVSGEVSWSWKFSTDRNAPITDGSKSLFLLYGKGDALDQVGQLQLCVEPEMIIQDFLSTLQTEFRFVVKTMKSSKGFVEVKLSPPSAKSFATLEALILSARYEQDVLIVRYEFKVKKIEATAAAFDIKKLQKKTEQKFSAQDYRLPSGRTNFAHMEAAIREALSLVEAKILF